MNLGQNPISSITTQAKGATIAIQQQSSILAQLKHKLAQLNTRLNFNPSLWTKADKVDNLVSTLITKLDTKHDEARLIKIQNASQREDLFALAGVIVLLGSIITLVYITKSKKAQ